MKRKEIKSKTIKQDNDASCFHTSNNPSQHNKRAKRLASKRLRQLIKKEDDA